MESFYVTTPLDSLIEKFDPLLLPDHCFEKNKRLLLTYPIAFATHSKKHSTRRSSCVLALERTLRPPETFSATITDQERNRDLRLLTLE